MDNTAADLQFLKARYTRAQNKYKPARIRVLLLAEAPPCSLERYFYFEDVPTQDSLFLEIMGVLYPDGKKRYLASGRDAELKEELLQTFKEDGYWLMDVSEIPTSLTKESLQSFIPDLLGRLQKHIERSTPIILIKASVYDACYEALKAEGYNVSRERLPFPGSGQQKVFREKFSQVLDTL